MKKVFVLIISILAFSQVYAIGHVSLAKVIHVRVDSSGKGMVMFDKQIAGTPATCAHVAYKNAFAIDMNTAGGKAALSLALTAKTTDSQITVYGLGVCGLYGGTNVESWNYGVIY